MDNRKALATFGRKLVHIFAERQQTPLRYGMQYRRPSEDFALGCLRVFLRFCGDHPQHFDAINLVQAVMEVFDTDDSDEDEYGDEPRIRASAEGVLWREDGLTMEFVLGITPDDEAEEYALMQFHIITRGEPAKMAKYVEPEQWDGPQEDPRAGPDTVPSADDRLSSTHPKAGAVVLRFLLLRCGMDVPVSSIFRWNSEQYQQAMCYAATEKEVPDFLAPYLGSFPGRT